MSLHHKLRGCLMVLVAVLCDHQQHRDCPHKSGQRDKQDRSRTLFTSFTTTLPIRQNHSTTNPTTNTSTILCITTVHPLVFITSNTFSLIAQGCINGIHVTPCCFAATRQPQQYGWSVAHYYASLTNAIGRERRVCCANTRAADPRLCEGHSEVSVVVLHET